MRRLGAEGDAAPADEGGRNLRTRVVGGNRPAPLRGSAASAAGRGAGEGRETCRMASSGMRPVPGRTVLRPIRRRGGAP